MKHRLTMIAAILLTVVLENVAFASIQEFNLAFSWSGVPRYYWEDSLPGSAPGSDQENFMLNSNTKVMANLSFGVPGGGLHSTLHGTLDGSATAVYSLGASVGNPRFEAIRQELMVNGFSNFLADATFEYGDGMGANAEPDGYASTDNLQFDGSEDFGFDGVTGRHITQIDMAVTSVKSGPAESDNSEGAIDLEVNVSLTVHSEPRASDPEPTPSVTVYLAFGEKVPAKLYQKKTSSGVKNIIERTNVDSEMAEPMELNETQRQKVTDALKKIFDDSGVDNIVFADSPEDATVVYFAEPPEGLNSPWGVGGMALDGVDFLNTGKDESVVVVDTSYLYNPPLQRLAEKAAHELGHSFGLSHTSDTHSDVVMDYKDTNANETFSESPQFLVKYNNGQPKNRVFKQNAMYHMKRFVDGMDAVAAALKYFPGTLDLLIDAGSFVHTMNMTITSAAIDPYLYDLTVFVGEAGTEGNPLTPIATFDEISLAELAEYSFAVGPFSSLELFASSTPGGDLDTVLAYGDPFDPLSTSITPQLGEQELGLYRISDPDLGTYELLGNVTVSGAASVPEPATLAIWSVLGLTGVGLTYLRRRRKAA